MPSLFKPLQEAGQNFTDMFKDVQPRNILSSLGSGIKQNTQNYLSGYSLAGNVARETAKAPLRVGGAVLDTGLQLAGKQPLPRTNIPGLGEFATPARNTYDESMQTNDPMQLASIGLRNASSGLFDAAGTISLASLAKTAMQKGGINIFRGETAANKGGVHWALDKADAKPFGTVSNRTIHPSEIVDESNPEVQKIVKEGADNLLEFPDILKNLWAKGYNAIENVDAITGKKGLIVNPAFTSKAEFAKDALGGATIPASTAVGDFIVQELEKISDDGDISPGFLTAALGTKPWDAEKKKAVRELENKIMNTRDKQARGWLIKNLKLLMKVVR